MPLPTSAFELGVVVLLILPGLVFAVVRRHLRGLQYDDLAIDTRIAQAIVVSALLNMIYLMTAWQDLSSLFSVAVSPMRVQNPARLGLVVLVGYVLLPALVAYAIYSPWRFRRSNDEEFGLFFRLERTIRASSTPTAWDKAASSPSHRLVRVRRGDGTWIGGVWGEGSFVSTYPQPRDLYLSLQCHMQEDGTFGEAIPDSEGVWLRITDADVVEFVTAVYTEEQLAEFAEQARASASAPRRPLWKRRPKEKR